MQAMQAYVIIGWSAQYLRDMGLSAAAAGLLPRITRWCSR
jgi:CP family cyanate transporter-like MFS transporter